MAHSRLCSIPDCGKPHLARGWCSAHYYRWQRTGDPLAGKPLKTLAGEAQHYYREAVLIYDGDDCLIWPYGRHNGYASMMMDGKPKFVSRVLCEETQGPPPTPKHQAAHSCGKGHLACVTKRHLSWKTPKANTADKIIHGTVQRGERHNMAKLSEQNVREIRALRGVLLRREIAAKFDVEPGTVKNIHAGRTWAWLE